MNINRHLIKSKYPRAQTFPAYTLKGPSSPVFVFFFKETALVCRFTVEISHLFMLTVRQSVAVKLQKGNDDAARYWFAALNQNHTSHRTLYDTTSARTTLSTHSTARYSDCGTCEVCGSKDWAGSYRCATVSGAHTDGETN